MFMQSLPGVIFFAACIAVSIIMSNKWNVSSGIFAIFFAYFIGTAFGGMGSYGIGKLFNGNFAVQVIVVCMFFGMLSVNGTMNKLCDKLLWVFRGAKWSVPFVLFLVCFVLAALGGGNDAAPLLMSPICFAVAMNAGYSPIMALLPVFFACGAGSMVVWLSTHAVCVPIFEAYFDHATSHNLVQGYLWVQLISGLVCMVVAYIVTGAYKKSASLKISKPEPFDAKQKLSMILLIGTIVLVVLPPLLQSMLPSSAAVAVIARVVNIRSVAGLGTIIACACNLGDAKEVFMKKVPWNMIVTVTGMMLLISVVIECGMMDYITSLVSSAEVSHLGVRMIIFFASAALSFVSAANSSAWPLAGAMAGPLNAAYGWSIQSMVMPAVFAGGLTALSPFSTGGSFALSGCPEEWRDHAYAVQLKWTFIVLIIGLVLELLGVSQLCYNIAAAISGL